MKQKITTIEHHILFDIDSTSVGGALVRHGKNNTGAVVESTELFSLRKNITDGTEYPFEKFFDRTLKTLRAVADEVHLQALITIDDIHINVSTPWMSAQKRVMKYEKKKPFIFTQELADELIQKEIKASLEHNIDYADHQVELIDRRTIDVYANGYPVRKPIDKEMNDVAVHSLLSVMSRDTKEGFTHIIEQVFHREPQYISNTFVMYQSVKTLLSDINDAVVIDLSGEVTELMVINDDHLEHLGSIPVGTHHIARSLRDSLKITIQKAHSLLRLHVKGHLDDDYKNTIEPALDAAFKVWFKSLYNLMDEYGRHGLLPHTMVLKAHNESIEWCREQLTKEDALREHLNTQGRIEIVLLSEAGQLNFADNELGLLNYIITQGS